MRAKLILKSTAWFTLSALVLFALMGCSSGGGGYQFQSPIKPAPPPPITQQHSLTVAPGTAKVIFVSVNTGDRLTGSFTIEGGSGNDINFSVKDPLGNVVLSGGRVSNSWRFDFVCASTGSYQLNFDNGFSLVSNKAINLTTTVYRSQ